MYAWPHISGKWGWEWGEADMGLKPQKDGKLGLGRWHLPEALSQYGSQGSEKYEHHCFEPNGMAIIFAFSSTLALQDHKTNSFNFTVLHLQHSYYGVKTVVSYCGHMCVGDLQFLKTIGHLA